MMLNLAVDDTVKQSSCAVALDTTYEMSKLVKFLPKRGSLLEKLKQELAPETPGFRMLCPDETRRGVEIVVEDLHKSFVNSSNIYIILAKISQLKRLKFWPKTHPKCIINAHRGTNKSKFSRGETPRTPLTRGESPSRTLPRSCLRHSLCLPPDHFQIRGDGHGVAVPFTLAGQSTFQTEPVPFPRSGLILW